MLSPAKSVYTKQPPVFRNLAGVCLALLTVLALFAGCGRAHRVASPETETRSPPSLTLVFGGDVMLGRGVAQALDGDWEAAFAEVHPWLDASTSSRTQRLVFANLESPLTAQPPVTEGYDLRAPPEAVAALRAASFDALSLANNHILDAGKAGHQETIDTLRETNILPWLAGTPVLLPGSPSVVGLALDDTATQLDLDSAAETVAGAAAQAEVVVVSIHWGAEYQASPSPRQREIARLLSEAGASVIVGHGPHVLQPVEMVRETLVAYSLGNLLFDQPYPVDCSWGVLLHVTMRGSQITKVEALPTVSKAGRVLYAGQETAKVILDRLDMDQE